MKDRRPADIHHATFVLGSDITIAGSFDGALLTCPAARTTAATPQSSGANGYDYNTYQLDVTPPVSGAPNTYFLNSVVNADNPHTSSNTQHLTFAIDYTVTIQVTGGGKLTLKTFDSNCKYPGDPVAMPTAPGVVVPGLFAMRIRSGFIPNVLGFGVRYRLTDGIAVSGYVALWATAETDSERTYYNNVTDEREGYLRIEGRGGSLLLGDRCLCSRGERPRSTTSTDTASPSVTRPASRSTGPRAATSGTAKAKFLLGWRPRYDLARMVEAAFGYRRVADDPRKVWYPG